MCEHQEFFTREGKRVNPHKVFDIKNGSGKYKYIKMCPRCSGQGGSDAWKFTGYTCYQCGGVGHLGTHIGRCYTQERLDKMDKALAARREKKAKEMAEKAKAAKLKLRMTRRETLADEIDTIMDAFHYRHQSRFLKDVLDTILSTGKMSEKQKAAIEDAIESVKQRKLAAEIRKMSEWVGEVGERVTLTLTLKRAVDLGKSMWHRGHDYLYIYQDESGNTIKTFGKNVVREGEQTKVKATVKKHEEYKGEKATVINRLKVIK
jgi:hypothetical protein